MTLVNKGEHIYLKVGQEEERRNIRDDLRLKYLKLSSDIGNVCKVVRCAAFVGGIYGLRTNNTKLIKESFSIFAVTVPLVWAGNQHKKMLDSVSMIDHEVIDFGNALVYMPGGCDWVSHYYNRENISVNMEAFTKEYYPLSFNYLTKNTLINLGSLISNYTLYAFMPYLSPISSIPICISLFSISFDRRVKNRNAGKHVLRLTYKSPDMKDNEVIIIEELFDTEEERFKKYQELKKE